MIEEITKVSYHDITLIGFTSEDNHGFPSKTHVNGENGDFRYLRTDKTGDALDISTDPTELDETRQEEMIDAFKNFGWKNFYSVYYTIDSESKKLKLCSKSSGHHNHLHSRNFKPEYKK